MSWLYIAALIARLSVRVAVLEQGAPDVGPHWTIDQSMLQTQPSTTSITITTGTSFMVTPFWRYYRDDGILQR